MQKYKNKIGDVRIQNKIILDYIDNNMTINELSEKYSLNPSTIINKLVKANVYKRKKHYWTNEELTILKNNYAESSWETILTLLPNISKQNIISKASKLGLKRNSYFWCNEDVQILIDNYGTLNSVEISKLLNKSHTLSAIKCKAKKLGLSYLEKWTDEEKQIVIENYSKIPIEKLLKLLPNKTYNAIQHMAKNNNLMSYFYLNTYYNCEQRQFIFDNWLKMSDSEIGKILNKTSVSIMEQRHKMGLYFLNKDYSGYESIVKFFRSHLTDWKNASMAKCEYKCIFTGSKEYEIHHIHGFNLIIHKVMIKLLEMNLLKSNNISNYSKEELDILLDIFLDIHRKYPLGVCLRKDIHGLFHKIYGSGGNNEMQWNKFKQDLLNGTYSKETAS